MSTQPDLTLASLVPVLLRRLGGTVTVTKEEYEAAQEYGVRLVMQNGGWLSCTLIQPDDAPHPVTAQWKVE